MNKFLFKYIWVLFFELLSSIITEHFSNETSFIVPWIFIISPSLVVRLSFKIIFSMSESLFKISILEILIGVNELLIEL